MAYKDFQPALRDLLAQHGWTIVHEEECRDDLWFLAIWTVESIWSPQGKIIYIVFEYDIHFHWASVSAKEPQDHQSTVWEYRLYLKRGWERDIPEFLHVLQQLRERQE